MTDSLLTVTAGALTGAACKGLSDVLLRRLLQKRRRAYTEGRGEKLLLFALMAAFGGAIAFLVPFSPEMIFYFLVLTVCEAVSVMDVHTRLIPNDLVLALMGLALLFGLPGCFGLPGWFHWRPMGALAGMLGCMLIFALPAAFSGKIGAGDVKLAAAMGFCMGLSGSLLAVVLMGICVLVFALAQNKVPMLQLLTASIPMGPFLALSMLTVLLGGRLPAVAALLEELPL